MPSVAGCLLAQGHSSQTCNIGFRQRELAASPPISQQLRRWSFAICAVCGHAIILVCVQGGGSPLSLTYADFISLQIIQVPTHDDRSWVLKNQHTFASRHCTAPHLDLLKMEASSSLASHILGHSFFSPHTRGACAIYGPPDRQTIEVLDPTYHPSTRPSDPHPPRQPTIADSCGRLVGLYHCSSTSSCSMRSQSYIRYCCHSGPYASVSMLSLSTILVLAPEPLRLYQLRLSNTQPRSLSRSHSSRTQHISPTRSTLASALPLESR